MKFEVNGSVIVIEETPGAFSTMDGTGLEVWDAARALARYLVAHPGEVAGQRTLELGAGCGLPSLVAEKLGAVVTMTDIDDAVLDVQRMNRDTNGSKAIVTKLAFGEAAGTVDMLLAADCLYLSKQIGPLKATIASAATCLFAHLPRRTWRFDTERRPVRDDDDEVLSSFLEACRDTLAVRLVETIDDVLIFRCSPCS